MSFKDLLNKQAVLDKTIGEKRGTGFKPRERTGWDIKLSMIAEIIEFNEETLETHKTWKEKKFDIDKAKEEAIDILFFFLQLVNYYRYNETNENRNIRIFIRDVDKGIYDPIIPRKYNLLILINKVIEGRIEHIYHQLCNIFLSLEMTKEDIANEYIKKWNKNMCRIKGEWSL